MGVSKAARVGLFFAATAGVLLVGTAMAGPVAADNDIHTLGSGSTATDKCATCHRAHTAQASYLLKSSVSQLCAACHRSGLGALTDPYAGWSYPDFVNSFNMMGLRGGGFETAAIDTTHATATPGKSIPSLVNQNAPVTSTHSIDGSAQTAWGLGSTGAGAAVNLNCTSCHDPHGNGNYRILRPIPKGGTGPAVNVPDATRKTYITFDYWNTADPFSAGFITNISSWCTQCHSRYNSSDAKVNTGDAMFTFRHKTTDATAGGPNCIQCHVAHGSNATMEGASSGSVTLPDGTPAPAGDSRLLRLNNRGICEMCHQK